MGIKIKKITTKEAKKYTCPNCKRKIAGKVVNGKCVNCYDPIRRRFHALKQSAKKRGLPFSLTIDTFREWWGTTPDVCAYCGYTSTEYIEIRDKIFAYVGDSALIYIARCILGHGKMVISESLSIDRIDNKGGYEFPNICKACAICNIIKGRYLTTEDMKRIKVVESIKEACLH